jgi:glutamate synthase (NADPH/NADH) small chain
MKTVLTNARFKLEKCVGCKTCTHVCPTKAYTHSLNRPLEKMKIAPCALECPIGNDIEGFVFLAGKQRYLEAYTLLLQTNPFPGTTGRVCHHPCEQGCSRMKFDESVSIRSLERFAADYAMEKGYMPPKPEVLRKSAVAVIGAGPAGLTAAGELAKRGHAVTIFEALHEPGGVLIYGIPEFRLPKAILKAEVEYLRRLGVEIRYNFVVGKTAAIDSLREIGFESFFIGTGAGLPNFMKIPGENLIGVYSANEYLTRVNLMRAYDFPNYDTPVFRAENAAVIGGGNVAMDGVRIARRLGARRAMIIYRRSRHEMPAREEEVAHAEEEGIEFHFLTVPIRYEGDANGRLRSMTCLRMDLGEPDASGRRRPVPVPGSEFTTPIDLAVVAIGQSPNPLLLETMPGLKIGKWGTIETDPATMATNLPGVYAGGDIIRGGATVILAMGDARAAAASMDAYLKSRVPSRI